MKIVSNASPIIFLTKLKATNILLDCFESVLIPEAVQLEIGNLPFPSGIQTQKISVAGKQYVEGALGRLHRGELEAMMLALESQADYILLDDLLARRKAHRLGLQVMGTIGVILLAHRQTKIAEKTALDWLDQLINRHGLYLSGKRSLPPRFFLGARPSWSLFQRARRPRSQGGERLLCRLIC